MSTFIHEEDPLTAVTDSPAEAENLRVRAVLMTAVIDQIAARKLTQRVAADLAGITAPRMSELCHGRIDKFSLDALVNIGAALGVRVTVDA
ncbi:helix-turn-helix domain-containing protein [Gordonia phosphorivorans]|uniref:Helix-turn-helix domain-containing protein n=1 Tax=Gordonia phosphorivorans TaxID=1056982 RepID=A0ABV6H450_9ACTN